MRLGHITRCLRGYSGLLSILISSAYSSDICNPISNLQSHGCCPGSSHSSIHPARKCAVSSSQSLNCGRLRVAVEISRRRYRLWRGHSSAASASTDADGVGRFFFTDDGSLCLGSARCQLQPPLIVPLTVPFLRFIPDSATNANLSLAILFKR